MDNSDAAFVAGYLAESAASMAAFATDPATAVVLGDMADAIATAFRAGGKLLIAGNGGSAADAQHIACEFITRMNYDRPPLPALALTTDTSVLTGGANDYGYDPVFERQVQGLGRPGDVFLAISTSGRSPNVLRACDAARAGGLRTLGFTGSHGGVMAERCDLLLRAPARQTPLIQQLHITAGHIVCSLVERAVFPRPDTAG
jgi:D-sedoheptulose 7-phosphate isomerase